MDTVIARSPAVAWSATVSCVVSWVELTKVVGRAVPLTFATVAGTKPDPEIVTASGAVPPATALEGATVMAPGAGLTTGSCTVFELPPPGVGFFTNTARLPADAWSAATSCAVTCEMLTTVVARALPLTSTWAPGSKLLPEMVSSAGAAATVTDAGDTAPMTGTGLLTMMVAAAVTPPPGEGVLTAIDRVPGVARSAAERTKVRLLELASVTGRDLPLTSTEEAATKLLPDTATVTGVVVPATIVVGETVMEPGCGLLTVKVETGDEPPPGPALVTTIESVAADWRSAGVSAKESFVELL